MSILLGEPSIKSRDFYFNTGIDDPILIIEYIIEKIGSIKVIVVLSEWLKLIKTAANIKIKHFIKSPTTY